MRNWHHKIIKLPQAIAKIPHRTPIRIGVMEGDIEYKMLNNPDNFGFNYQASNEGLQDSSIKKVIHFIPSSPVRPSLTILNSSSHATSVAGVIAANDAPALPIKGVLSDSSIFNFRNNILNFLVNSGIEWNFYENNRIALNTRDTSLNLENSKLGIVQYSFDTVFTAEQARVPVINSSIAYNEGLWNRPRSADEKSVRNTTKHLFNTIKAYSNDGRGTLICLAAGNNNVNTTSEQYLSNYNYPFIIASSCLTNGTTISNSSEIRAGYSSYGDQVDISAPSSGRFDLQSPPQLIKRRIFTTTNKFCGDIGTDSEIYNYNVTSTLGNNKVTLDIINGLFAGNCLELGNPSTDQHDIMVIKDIDRINRIVTFTEDRYFTLGLNLTGATVRVPVLKNSGIITGNTMTLNSPKGMGYVGQKLYIGDNHIGHFASISNVINSTTFQFNPQIPLNITLPVNYDIIPDQTVLNISNHVIDPNDSSNYIFSINSTDSNKLICAFKGGLMLLIGTYNDGANPPVDIELQAHINNIDLISNKITIEKINLQNINIREIKTIGYGSYTSSFGGTSSASPLLAGVAGLLLQANPNLNVLELKHILKEKADKIGSRSYSLENSDSKKNYGYIVNSDLGAGRVNAENSVQLALDWHDPAKSSTTLKPTMEIADRLTGFGIWVKPLRDSSPNIPITNQPLNAINTLVDQKIYVKILNTGSRKSFKECDLRVFVAFTDDPNPAFPFPNSWYDQEFVKLLSVTEIPIIPAGGYETIEIEWKDIASKWNIWNRIDTTTGRRKKAYLLAHIAPFDGIPGDVRTDNINFNKQLISKRLTVEHNGVADETAFIPGNKLDITVDSQLVEKNFSLIMENVLTADITKFKIKASKKHKDPAQTIQEVFYKKTGDAWGLEPGSTGNWITFYTPIETEGDFAENTNIKFPHTINVNNNELEIKLEIVNI